MKAMRWTFVLAALVLFMSLPALAKDGKIGHIDLQKALNESVAGIKAKEALQAEADSKEAELDVMQDELKLLKEEVEKKGALWNEETRAAKEAEFKAKSGEFQKQFMAYGEELSKKKKETEGRILDGLTAAVEDVAKEEGYDYVFERAVGGMIVADPDADLTDKVIKLYNKKYTDK